MFRFVLLLPDDSPYDPPCLVTNVADYPVGTEIDFADSTARVLDADTAPHSHLRALGFSGILTVEPVEY